MYHLYLPLSFCLFISDFMWVFNIFWRESLFCWLFSFWFPSCQLSSITWMVPPERQKQVGWVPQSTWLPAAGRALPGDREGKPKKAWGISSWRGEGRGWEWRKPQDWVHRGTCWRGERLEVERKSPQDPKRTPERTGGSKAHTGQGRACSHWPDWLWVGAWL